MSKVLCWLYLIANQMKIFIRSIDHHILHIWTTGDVVETILVFFLLSQFLSNKVGVSSEMVREESKKLSCGDLSNCPFSPNGKRIENVKWTNPAQLATISLARRKMLRSQIPTATQEIHLPSATTWKASRTAIPNHGNSKRCGLQLPQPCCWSSPSLNLSRLGIPAQKTGRNCISFPVNSVPLSLPFLPPGLKSVLALLHEAKISYAAVCSSPVPSQFSEWDLLGMHTF